MWWKLNTCLNLLFGGNLIIPVNLGPQGQSDHLGQTGANCHPPSQLPTHCWCCRQTGPNPALLELGTFAVSFFKESYKSVRFFLAISELYATNSVNTLEFCPQSIKLVKIFHPNTYKYCPLSITPKAFFE